MTEVEGMTEVVGKSVEELEALRVAIDAEMASAKERAKEEFNTLVENVILKSQELGIDLKAVLFPKKELTPKYKNPSGPETWNGRGPYPQWLKELVKDAADSKEAIKAYLIEA